MKRFIVILLLSWTLGQTQTWAVTVERKSAGVSAQASNEGRRTSAQHRRPWWVGVVLILQQVVGFSVYLRH